MNFMQAQKYPRAGFTLVELIVVMLIIGILAAFSVTSYRTSVESSRLSEAQAVLTSAAAQLEAQFAKDNVWPPAWTNFPANPNFTFSYSNAVPVKATATRSGGSVFDGNKMSLERQSPGAWCWRWTGANGGMKQTDTPIPANRFCP